MESRTINNPIFRGMYPDPSWIWDDASNSAVLVNSSFELVPGLPLRASSDMCSWESIGCAVDEAMAQRLLLDCVEDSGGLYAPTLRKIHGKYVIVCTVARVNRDKALARGVSQATLDEVERSKGNFVITADQLSGPWQGPYWVCGAEEIDPDIFEDCDGSVWWTQTRPARDPQWEGQTEVWTSRIDPQTWQLVPDVDAHGNIMRTILWRGYGVEAVWAEGPHLYRIGDWVYLMTAEGGTSFEHSEMAMRTYAPSGLGEAIRQYLSEEDSYSVRRNGANALEDNECCVLGTHDRLFHANKKNPILTHRHLGLGEPVQCVGHTDMLCMPSGQWWVVCLGTRETRGTAPGELLSYFGRETFVAPVEWENNPAQWQLESDGVSSEEPSIQDPGWPVIAPGIGKLPHVIYIDDSDQISYGEQSQSNTEEVIQVFPECMELNPSDVVSLSKMQGHRFIRCDSADFKAVSPADCGVIIFQDSRNQVHVYTKDSRIVMDVLCSSQASTHDLGQILPQCMIAVRMHNNTLQCWKYSAQQEMAEVFEMPADIAIDMRFLSTEWSGGFVGLLVGV